MTEAHVSKVIFNREGRLPTWLAVMSKTIEPPEPFCRKDLVSELADTGTNPTAIHNEIHSLLAFDAIVPMPEYTGGAPKSVYYRRVESEIWPLVAAVAEVSDNLAMAGDS